METISTQALADVCRIFMELAYPRGIDSIPPTKRAYFQIAPDAPITNFLTPAPQAVGICQDISKRLGSEGWEFRLGCEIYPHIKLRIQRMDFHQRFVWVYSVDTHDGFHQATIYLSPEESAQWRITVDQNRILKQKIEDALTAAGYVTPKNLLQMDLASPTP